jgi:hypothetical protein
MTTFAAPQDTERELEERTAAAWTAYRDELQGLGGQEYADTEMLAWDRLQAQLREIEALRAELPPVADGTR